MVPSSTFAPVAMGNGPLAGSSLHVTTMDAVIEVENEGRSPSAPTHDHMHMHMR